MTGIVQMIFCKNTRHVLDSLGWIEKGAIWVLDVDRKRERLIEVPGANYVSLKAGEQGFFRVVHHRSAGTAVSIRHVEAPDQELAGLRFIGGNGEFLGQSNLWRMVESAVLQVLDDGGYRLFVIDPNDPSVLELDQTWYTGGNYDLVYQGLVDCLSLPDRKRVVISVQRSSRLVVLDKKKGRPVAETRLPGHEGNPDLLLRLTNDFLATDYDVLARVDCNTLEVLASARLQEATAEGSHAFIGDYYLWSDRRCAVARPFSGDAILVDPVDFRTVGRTLLGGEPLTICMISESQVVTRDWKTGEVKFGEFCPIDGAS